MNTQDETSDVDVNFIRLFFPSPTEERVAVRWARWLSSLLGEEALRLRPETTITEIFSWFEARQSDAAGFALAVAEELGLEQAALGDDWDRLTFREFVQLVSQIESAPRKRII